jgi:hypothetical protein
VLKDFCTWLIENAYPDYERLYRASEGFIPILRSTVESYFQDINEAGSKALLRNKAERIIDQLFADGAVALYLLPFGIRRA